MSNEERVLKLKNRINLLRQRTDKENGKIIKKLERQLRNLGEETPA